MVLLAGRRLTVYGENWVVLKEFADVTDFHLNKGKLGILIELVIKCFDLTTMEELYSVTLSSLPHFKAKRLLQSDDVFLVTWTSL